jgi:Leucine-rich repeat (LRR) protein
MPLLSYFTFTQNKLTAMPNALFAMPNLQVLALGSNAIAAPLPAWAASTCALTVLDLSSNMVTGALDRSWASCVALTSLGFSNNLLGGSVQSSLFDGMSRLSALSLANNSFSGPLPTLANCTALTSLDLSLNQFTGDAPISWTVLRNLVTLNLAWNRLNGLFKAVQALTSLTTISWAHNAMTVPANVGTIYGVCTLHTRRLLDCLRIAAACFAPPRLLPSRVCVLACYRALIHRLCILHVSLSLRARRRVRRCGLRI